jgi:formylglycine-generating enzyme required for sulfatase activity
LPPPPPDAAPPEPDACIASAEVCNGADDDCDGEIDETDPDDCQPCGVAGAVGLCARGRFACVAGALTCVPDLPVAGTGGACNALDDDCDGEVDEAGDRAPEADPADRAALAHCGPPVVGPETRGLCPDGTIGCAAGHVCVEAACRDACAVDELAGRASCEAVCPATEPLRGACLSECDLQQTDAASACRAACGAIDLGGATRWTCTEAEGAVCTATACPEGTRPRGDRCEPRVEICNNGLDDDLDGLVDGVLRGDDPCAVPFDLRGTPQQMGRCAASEPGTPCEDADRMSQYTASVDEYGSVDGATPRMVDLTYRYALDREEVSIRAYAECVASGCCLEPVSPAYRRAKELLAAGVSAERPEAPDRCKGSPDPLVPAEDVVLPDLPVTGLSWCMARDYCNWVGKRLPTEFEWERAATGPSEDGPQAGQRRIFPWGDEPPPDCVEAQCCRSEDYAGVLPAACQDGYVDLTSELRICPDGAPPGGTRAACLGTYNKQEVSCQGDVHGPAPAYANQDGATPEGLFNMAGNVTEWVYDWDTEGLWDLSTTNPVGAGCDATDFGPKRSVRGRDFTSLARQMRTIDRFSMWESSRAPNIGFRCGRTLTDDEALCDPRMPLANRDRCLPGADARTGSTGRDDLPACPGPDFDGQDPVDLARCGGAPRAHSEFCDDGIDDFCPSDIPTGDADGCGSFVISRLALPAGVAGEADGIGLLNSVFETSLAPNGGSTYLVLGAPAGFQLSAGNWPFGFGSADVDAAGRLVWLGREGLQGCDALPYGEFPVRTLDQRRDLTPVCRAVVQSDIWLREAPVSLAFSALALEARYEPIDDTLRGTLTLIMTFGDTERLRIGASGTSAGALDEVLARIGAGAVPLCGVPIAANCFAQPLFMPGCLGPFQCETPETCMGWGLPFEFEAVRASRSGLPALARCAAGD